MSTITLNEDQRLFVLKQEGGFSCLGFDVVFKRLKQFASLLGRPAPAETEVGTLKQYHEYREVERDYIATKPQNTLYDPDTDPQVRQVLEQAMASRRRVRLVLGNTETGQSWLDEHEVVGTIGRSMGPLKVPLLVESGECGGPAILTACILRILDTRTKAELYRHPKYQDPVLTVRPRKYGTLNAEVLVDGKVVARFVSVEKANDWCAFMRGERMSP